MTALLSYRRQHEARTARTPGRLLFSVRQLYTAAHAISSGGWAVHAIVKRKQQRTMSPRIAYVAVERHQTWLEQISGHLRRNLDSVVDEMDRRMRRSSPTRALMLAYDREERERLRRKDAMRLVHTTRLANNHTYTSFRSGLRGDNLEAARARDEVSRRPVNPAAAE